MKSKNLFEPELTLVTGFLGSGKTTFLKKLLGRFPEVKKAIIVNDFGKVALDGDLLRKQGDFIGEVAGGSIFCSCREDEFVRVLNEMLQERPERIFVETSGLSDPSSVERLLPLAASPLKYSGSYCVIDSQRYLALREIFTILDRQVTASDAIVLNKIDLVAPARIDRVERELLSVKKLPIYPARHGSTESNLALPRHESFMERSLENPGNRPKTLLLDWNEKIEVGRLEAFLREILPFALRVKGVCQTTSGDFYVSGVGESLEITEAGNIPHTGLTVIAHRGKPLLKFIRWAWDNHLGCELKVS